MDETKQAGENPEQYAALTELERCGIANPRLRETVRRFESSTLRQSRTAVGYALASMFSFADRIKGEGEDLQNMESAFWQHQNDL